MQYVDEYAANECRKLWRIKVMPKTKPIFRKYFLVPLLLLITFGSFSLWGHGSTLAAEEGDNVFTLSESVALALKKSLAMDSAAKTVEGTILDKKKAIKAVLPTLNLTYSHTRIDNEPETSSSQMSFMIGVVPVTFSIPGRQLGTRDNWQAKLGLTQPIFTGFKLLNAYRLAKLGIDVAEISQVQEELDLILKVKGAYFNILQAQKASEVAKQSIKSMEAHLNVARNFFEVGMITKNQVLEAEVKLAEAIQASIKAENFILMSKANFNNLLRRSLDAPIEVEDILKYKPFTHDFDYCLEQAMKDRPEIKAIMKKIEMAEQQVRLAKGDYYPTVALTANHYLKGDTWQVRGSDYIEDYTSWDVTAALSWNFWDWGKTCTDVKKKRTELAKARNGLIQLEDGIRLEVKNSYLSIKEAEKNIAVTRKAIELAEENHRMSQERYRAQVGTSTEVIDAATMLTAVRRSYYDALYSYNLAWATLERAMGLGRGEI